MTKRIANEVAILDASSGSVSIHTLPQSVKTEQDLQDYLYIVLEINSDSEYIAADEIALSDFRTKIK